MTAATAGTDKMALISVSYSGTGLGIPGDVTVVRERDNI
jgi:hypothetical protein